MAVAAQFSKLRRQATAAGSTKTHSSTQLTFGVSGTTYTIVSSAAAADFTADGFAANMRLVTDSSNNTRVFTIRAVAATKITLFEACTAQAPGTPTVTLTAHTFNPVGEVRNISGPSMAIGFVDVTHLGSTAKEYLVQGSPDPGEVTFDLLWRSSADDGYTKGLIEDHTSRIQRAYDIVLGASAATRVNPEGIVFDAFVRSFQITAQTEQALQGSVTLRLTSSIKWVPETTV